MQTSTKQSALPRRGLHRKVKDGRRKLKRHKDNGRRHFCPRCRIHDPLKRLGFIRNIKRVLAAL